MLRLAREALQLDGASGATGLQVSVNRRRKVVRLAYVAPFTQGRPGAHWYAAHHALPRLLSRAANTTVQAYVYDPDEGEEVIAYGNGRRVGGERVVYDNVDLPEGRPEDLDEAAFLHMQSRWPMGHLAHVFGLSRQALLKLPVTGQVLGLEDSTADVEAVLESLLPGSVAPHAH
ncbi:hypothetical protein SAMN05443572_106180 [Myxococcus fulvus]|uniref:Uncharacterized protein n=1 Tax=Myxococcus fulvus TaxID=33 RepID=A0A511T2L6_MYXFU|nr:hypothetical protein [Myxococcus fulvus]AKF82796.1 hypothetical protein MFUL124B02_30425 [Myxococcus fulvus 124B02]GEN08395.1 hypothetical protein MFU01_34320 [Myxococcus fulvus]SEU20748.1 hypothetical protein SAMN05443572_106180 [Myxococcus fulvus]